MMLSFKYLEKYNITSDESKKLIDNKFNKIMFFILCLNKDESFICKINSFLRKSKNHKYINVINSAGFTPLLIACNIFKRDLRYGVCEQLLKLGADVNVKTNLGTTPIALITNSDAQDINLIKLFIDYGVNFNTKNYHKEYIIMSYARRMSIDATQTIDKIISLMIINGADFMATDTFGDLPFQKIPAKYLKNYINLHSEKIHHRLCMRKLKPQIISSSDRILLNPNSIRIKCMNIKYDLMFNNFDNIIKLDNFPIFDYLSTSDMDNLIYKIDDICKYQY
ncbi:repeat protein [Moumouvirus goulette]|uniref:Repeat protein n=1 Tax=Moumouvirus goulette TaxID=1247379 RepID=M1NLY3_9VIRU|nr:repeat protein [Moumouvirus goulette]AGF85015.1 repeat protein [Moumouvirus goulette]